MLRLRPAGDAQHERKFLYGFTPTPFVLSPSASSGQAARSEVEGRKVRERTLT